MNALNQLRKQEEKIPIKINNIVNNEVLLSKHLYDIEKFNVINRTNGTLVQLTTNKKFTQSIKSLY